MGITLVIAATVFDNFLIYFKPCTSKRISMCKFGAERVHLLLVTKKLNNFSLHVTMMSFKGCLSNECEVQAMNGYPTQVLFHKLLYS